MPRKTLSNASTACPCGNPQPYEACCGQYHHGPERLQAPDALTLMRSRYSAFVLDETDYLLETWHPETRPQSVAPNEPGTKWLGLRIIRHVEINTEHATVEFIARVRNPHGQAQRQHEVSRFTHMGGRWFYFGGNFET